MKTLYCAGLMMLAAGSASAQQFEVLTLGSVQNNDSSFKMLSVRSSLGNDLSSGLFVRVDAGRAAYSYDSGGVQTNGQKDQTRALIGYTFNAGGWQFKALGGVTKAQLTLTPTNAFVTDYKRTGYFVGLEASGKAGPGDLFVLGEYSSPDEVTYASAAYMFGNDSFSVGPTVNYVTEPTYNRHQYGLRGSVNVTDAMEVTLGVTTGKAQTSGFGATTVNSAELQLVLKF